MSGTVHVILPIYSGTPDETIQDSDNKPFGGVPVSGHHSCLGLIGVDCQVIIRCGILGHIHGIGTHGDILYQRRKIKGRQFGLADAPVNATARRLASNLGIGDGLVKRTLRNLGDSVFDRRRELLT